MLKLNFQIIRRCPHMYFRDVEIEMTLSENDIAIKFIACTRFWTYPLDAIICVDFARSRK